MAVWRSRRDDQAPPGRVRRDRRRPAGPAVDRQHLGAAFKFVNDLLNGRQRSLCTILGVFGRSVAALVGQSGALGLVLGGPIGIATLLHQVVSGAMAGEMDFAAHNVHL